MGRAERRRQEKLVKQQSKKKLNLPKISVSQADLVQMQHEVSEMTATFYIEAFYTCFAYALNKDFEFGKKRIEKALGSVESLFDEINKGTVSVESMQHELKEKINLELNFTDETEEPGGEASPEDKEFDKK